MIVSLLSPWWYKSGRSSVEEIGVEGHFQSFGREGATSTERFDGKRVEALGENLIFTKPTEGGRPRATVHRCDGSLRGCC